MIVPETDRCRIGGLARHSDSGVTVARARQRVVVAATIACLPALGIKPRTWPCGHKSYP